METPVYIWARVEFQIGMKRADNHYSIDLPRHMAECDANYLRIMRLFPGLRDRHGDTLDVTIAGRRAEVSIEVLERSPYTTVIRLTQGPEAPSPWGLNPGFTVRIYHDARCAEVVEYQRARHFKAVYAYPNDAMRQKDEKVQVNRFLGEFLSYCLRNGVALREPAPVS